MKKTITITIGNTTFSIDEDAYAVLDEYLQSIKRHYADNKDADEILADIESGIAEKFADVVKGNRKSVTVKDVEDVIAVMGSVDEIGEGDFDGTHHGNSSHKEKRGSKKLYRSEDDVVIGGVASGIAAYFGTDPIIIRLLFLVLALFKGVGVLIYLVCLAIMPKATTSAQKLEMEGKPVNLSGIQEVIKEKSKMIGKEGKVVVEKMKEKKVWHTILHFPVRVIRAVFRFVGVVFKKLAPVVSVFVGVIILIAMVSSILALSVGIAAALFNINSPYIISDIPLQEIASSVYYSVGIVSAYVIALVPFLFLLLFGVTLVRRKNSFGLPLSIVLLVVWMAGIVGGVVAFGQLAPRVYTAIAEQEQYHVVTVPYDYTDFDAVQIVGDARVSITKGNEFEVSVTSRDRDADRFEVGVTDGVLTIIKEKYNKFDGNVCVLCFERPADISIIMPRLDAVEASPDAVVTTEGFDN